MSLTKFSRTLAGTKDGKLYTVFSYPDYFSNDFYFVRNLNTDDQYFKFKPLEDLNSESIRSMPTTSLIDFYIDKNGKMEYWCYGIDKLFSTSKAHQTNIDWNIALNNHISRPISIHNKALYFFILHEGGIINFLYSKAPEQLKVINFQANQYCK